MVWKPVSTHPEVKNAGAAVLFRNWILFHCILWWCCCVQITVPLNYASHDRIIAPWDYNNVHVYSIDTLWVWPNTVVIANYLVNMYNACICINTIKVTVSSRICTCTIHHGSKFVKYLGVCILNTVWLDCVKCLRMKTKWINVASYNSVKLIPNQSAVVTVRYFSIHM